MDAKDQRTDSVLGEGINNGVSNYNQTLFQSTDKNKTYLDIGSSSSSKVGVRPCAVIGPDRVAPPHQVTGAHDTRRTSTEPWSYIDHGYQPPPPYKLSDYQHPSRNISPRQTFQENMPRIMVPRYIPPKSSDDHNFSTEKNNGTSKPSKIHEVKYPEVPYKLNPLTNEQKHQRSTEALSSMNQSLLRPTTQGWPPGGAGLRPPNPGGPSDIYQYPEYAHSPVPRTLPMIRTQRAPNEEPPHMYPDYYRGGSVRFEPYPTMKERYPAPRYEYIPNYTSPYQPPLPHYLPQKYDLQKLHPSMLQHPQYVGHPQATFPRDSVLESYQRHTKNQPNFNVPPYHGHIVQGKYNPNPGNPMHNKLYQYPPADHANYSPVSVKPPYDTNNKYFVKYDNSLAKPYQTPESYGLNEFQRTHQKNQMMIPNYPANMHQLPYYRKENMPSKNVDFYPQFKPTDPYYNHLQSRIPPQFSPSIISPSDSLASNEMSHTFANQEDCGYASQSSTTSVRSTDLNMYKMFDTRYRHLMGTPTAKRMEMNSRNLDNSEKKKLDLRQFLQSWNEEDEENSDKANAKEVVNPGNDARKHYEVVNNPEQLYVLGLVNVPSNELSKYEHIQKVSKLPENIKGYTSIELLNQFEEAIESSNINNYSMKLPNPKEPRVPMNPTNVAKSIGLPNRPVSPLDVESKISQSVIHKDVGCNFEIRPCSPKMLNVQLAAPAQSLLGERHIEKITNPVVANLVSNLENKPNNKCDVIKSSAQKNTVNDNDNELSAPSCKMIKSQYKESMDFIDPVKTSYSVQDLESNSGVCLASLPRLDNDIELNFPEVNQQFINANKPDSMNAENVPAFESPEPSDNVLIPETNIKPPKDFDSTPMNDETDINDLTVKPTIDEQYIPPKTVQPIRTNSVIIKNPENIDALNTAGVNCESKPLKTSLAQSTTKITTVAPLNYAPSEQTRQKIMINKTDKDIGDSQRNQTHLVCMSKSIHIFNDDLVTKCSKTNDIFPTDVKQSTENERQSLYNQPKDVIKSNENETDIQEMSNDYINQESNISSQLLEENNKSCDSEKKSCEHLKNENIQNTSSNNYLKSPSIEGSREHVNNQNDKTELLEEQAQKEIDQRKTNLQEKEDVFDEAEFNTSNNKNVTSLLTNKNETTTDVPEINTDDRSNNSLKSPSIKESREHVNNQNDKTEILEEQSQKEIDQKKINLQEKEDVCDEAEFNTSNNENVTSLLKSKNDTTTDVPEINTDETTENVSGLLQDVDMANKEINIFPTCDAILKFSNNEDNKIIFENAPIAPPFKMFKTHGKNKYVNVDFEIASSSFLKKESLIELVQSKNNIMKVETGAIDVFLPSKAAYTANDDIIVDSSQLTNNDLEIVETLKTIDIETHSSSSSETELNQSPGPLFKRKIENLRENIQGSRKSIELEISEPINCSDESKNTNPLLATTDNSISVLSVQSMVTDCSKYTCDNTECEPNCDLYTTFKNSNEAKLQVNYSAKNIEDKKTIKLLKKTRLIKKMFSPVFQKLIMFLEGSFLPKEETQKPSEYQYLITSSRDDEEKIDQAIEKETRKEEEEKERENNSDKAQTCEISLPNIPESQNHNNITDTDIVKNTTINEKDINIKVNMHLPSGHQFCNKCNEKSSEELQKGICKLCRLEDKIPKLKCSPVKLKKRALKRSLSESALYDKQSKDQRTNNTNWNIEDQDSLWPNKRKKDNKDETETPKASNFLIKESSNYCNFIPVNRRYSISSPYEGDISFCILIDDNCIIAEEQYDGQEAICYTGIVHESLETTDQKDSILKDVTDIKTSAADLPQEEDTPVTTYRVDFQNENGIVDSWVDDVACVETVVSDDVDEEDDIKCSRESSPLFNSDDSQTDEEHTRRIKQLYGNELCSNDIELIKTLYSTPQMDLSRTLHDKESHIFETECRYENDRLEQILSGYDDNVFEEKDKENIQILSEVIESGNHIINTKETNVTTLANDTAPNKNASLEKAQDDIVHSCDLDNDEDVVGTLHCTGDLEYKRSSSSPEVSSTTMEDKKSGILLKIRNYGGEITSHIDNVDSENKKLRCKLTEARSYLCSKNDSNSSKPLLTKAAQKYIPPIKETRSDLKVKLRLPEKSLSKLKLLKLSKVEPKISSNKSKNNSINNNVRSCAIKKPKPKFEDVLKNIDEVHIKMHKEKSKKAKNAIPKMIIKKTINGSHYTSSTCKDSFNPDLTGRKWQPWVFIEKNAFIEKMALRGKSRAIYCHRKKSYIFLDKFRKYKSVCTSNPSFIISSPKYEHISGPLKYTIRLKRD